MTLRWREVWNQRTFAEDQPIVLQRRINAADWRRYMGAIAQQLTLSDGSSIYEIGRGAGVRKRGGPHRRVETHHLNQMILAQKPIAPIFCSGGPRTHLLLRRNSHQKRGGDVRVRLRPDIRIA